MLDKIRLKAAGKLTKAYEEFLGSNFDGRCLNLLGVTYDDVKKHVAAGETDEQILDWCLANGRKPTAEDIETWSGFMIKRGWRDDASPRVLVRLKESNLEHLDAQVATMFDYIEIDEKRTPPRLHEVGAPARGEIAPREAHWRSTATGHNRHPKLALAPRIRAVSVAFPL
jgi:gluconokinase